MTHAWNLDVPPPLYVHEDDTREVSALIQLLLARAAAYPQEPIGFDTETHGYKIPVKGTNDKPAPSDPLDWMRDTVTFWSLSARMDGETYNMWVAYVKEFHPEILVGPDGEVVDPDPYARWCLPFNHLHRFGAILENPEVTLATWNGKYDAHVCWNSGINLFASRIWDLMVAGFLLDENLQGNMGLKIRAEKWVNLHMTKFQDLFGNVVLPDGTAPKEFITDLRFLPLEDVVHYASYDAYATLKLYEYLKENLEQERISDGYSMWDYFLDMEVPCTEVLWRMERRGLLVDLSMLAEARPKAEAEIRDLKLKIVKATGNPNINIGSPKQLVGYFFNSGRYKPIKMTTKGGSTPSTDESVLSELALRGDPVAAMIVRLRKVTKILGTYINALEKMALHHEDHRIHPSFNQYGARTGRFSTNSPNCFDGRTEILTPEGWESVGNLSLGKQSVAQWDPRTDTISFVAPTNVIHQPYDGNMVVLLNQHIDLVLTPDHRCPLIGRDGKLRVVPASEYKADFKQLHAALYAPKSSLDLSHAELRFLVAVQADGSWSYDRIDLGFNKVRKAERLERILTEIDAEFKVRKDPSKKINKFRFTVRGGAVSLAKEWLTERKQFGPWVARMGRDQLAVFCEELFHWDGCLKNESMYSSSEKVNADWAQIALLLNGQRAKIREYMPKSGRVNYQVDTVKRGYSWTTNIEKTEVKSDGVVHCLTVPSGFVVVRRNGKACISGQSQNFPRPDGDEFGIRKMFVARPGWKLIVGDYEQLEMRIMAHMSKDESMLHAIREGMDLHCYTVAKMFSKITYEEVIAAKKAETPTPGQVELKRMRQAAKAIGFGLIYGAAAPRIAQQLEIDVDEAQDKIDAYFAAFPGVAKFIVYTHLDCKEKGYVSTILGRRRRLPDINSHVRDLRSVAERESVNSIIQGTAADITKAAMLNIEFDAELNSMSTWMLNQIHDELVIEIPEEYAELALPRIKNFMDFPFQGQQALCIPTPAELHIVDNWAAAK